MLPQDNINNNNINPLESSRTSKQNGNGIVAAKNQFLPKVPENNNKKVNEYYESFMQDHFLFDQETNKASNRLKQRLMHEAIARNTENKKQFANSTMLSPIKASPFLLDNKSFRIADTNNYNNNTQLSFLKMKKDQSFDIKATTAKTPQTFYMIDVNDHQRQTKLGIMEFSKNENLLKKNKFLFDAKKLRESSVSIKTKALMDIKPENEQKSFHIDLKQRKGSEITVDRDNQNISSLSEQIKLQKIRDQFGSFYYEDQKKQMLNPMKQGEITFTELFCIDKMKQLGKWNEKDGLNRVDSLIESAYNSEKNSEWRKYRPESRDRLLPTEASEEEFDLFKESESEEEDDLLIDEPEIRIENHLTTKIGEQVKQKMIKEHEENENQKKSQNGKVNSDSKMRKIVNTMKNSMRKHFTFDQIEIGGMHISSIKENGPKIVILKNKEQALRSSKLLKSKYINEIFRHYCNELQIAPVKFLNYYSKGIIQLHNYNIQPNLCIAIACTIPYLTDLEGIKLKNNGIKDEGAALLIKACSLCPKFKIFHLEKNEVNTQFVQSLKEVLEEHPRAIQELSLSNSKNFTKIVSKLCQTIRESLNLTFLNLSHNNMDAISCKHVGHLIKNTIHLQHINLSYCGIRGHSARIILNALLLNQSVKYLNLCWNSFSSVDYEFGSKIARMLQIHQSLIHVDLTCTQLKREETMYIAQCLKDSYQIISCHLTGNHVDYYSRIFLRAHLNAIVQFPFKNSNSIQNALMAHDRVQILSLNQQIQSNIYQPSELQPIRQQSPTAGIKVFNITDTKNNANNNNNNMYDISNAINKLKSPIKNVNIDGKNTPNLTNHSKHLSQHSKNNNIQHDINSEITDEQEKEQENSRIPVDLRAYLRSDKNRIFDMVHMIDLYGRKEQKEQLETKIQLQMQQTNQHMQGRFTAEVINHDEIIQALKARKIKAQNKKNSFKLDQEGTIRKQKQARQSQDTNFQKAMNVIFQAYDDKLQANPMQGFLKDFIFARYLGHPEIDEDIEWRDCNQCWICERWDKVQIDFQLTDAIVDSEFDQIQEQIQQLAQQQNEQDLNPIWEENFESLDDEKITRQSVIGNGNGVGGGVVGIMNNDGDGNKRLIYDMQKNNNSKQNMNSFHSEMPQSTTKIIMNQSHQQIMNSTMNSQYIENDIIKEPDTYDQNIVKIKENGPMDLTVKDLEGKILYNSHIFSTKLNVQKIQKQIIPTANLIYNNHDGQVILNQGCVPYKPFQKIQPQTKEQHVIKLPNIYQSQDRNKEEQTLTNSTINTGVVSLKKQQNDFQNKKYANDIISIFMEDLNHQQDNDQGLPQSQQFQQYGYKISPRKRTKNEILKTNQEIMLNFQKVPETDDVYFVASFNHWLPIKMKINIKKKIQRLEEKAKKAKLGLNQGVAAMLHLQEDDDLDEDIDEDENPMYSYVNFLPHGKHYFYFIKKGKYFCLSERYTVKQFKNTNLFMNEIIVAKRDHEITEVQSKDKGLNGPHFKFDKLKSVFKSYKEDTEESVRKMFELDFSYCKIPRIIKNNEDELQRVKEIFWLNYNRIRNIFLTITLSSEYPVITWNDFTLICNKCKVVDKICNLSIIDTIYIATNVSLNNQSNADRDLCRYEFLEILMRLGNEKYKKQGLCNTYSEALQKILDENIYPNMEEINPQIFRDTQLYNYEVNELLAKNDAGIRRLYDTYIHGQKRYINFKDAIDLINLRAELRFLDKQVVKQFGLSKMSHIDINKDPNQPIRMQYVEFLEFLGRIAFEVFKDHPEIQVPKDFYLFGAFKIKHYL